MARFGVMFGYKRKWWFMTPVKLLAKIVTASVIGFSTAAASARAREDVGGEASAEDDGKGGAWVQAGTVALVYGALFMLTMFPKPHLSKMMNYVVPLGCYNKVLVVIITQLLPGETAQKIIIGFSSVMLLIKLVAICWPLLLQLRKTFLRWMHDGPLHIATPDDARGVRADHPKPRCSVPKRVAKHKSTSLLNL